MTALYNDIEDYPCKILKLRIEDGWLPKGEVTNEDIRTLCQKDLSKYNQVHLFAGIGGFPLAARMSGVPDAFRLFTGGFPCQPFSSAGRRAGTQDNRYLWPETYAAFKSQRPDVAIFENVAGLTSMGFASEKTLVDIKTLAGRIRHYFYRRKALAVVDKILNQIEEAGYSVQAFVIPACAVDARHRRDRIWIVAIRNDLANTGRGRRGKSEERQDKQSRRTEAFSASEDVANAESKGSRRLRVGKTAAITVIGSARENDVPDATSKRPSRQGQHVKPVNSTAGQNGKAGQFIHDGDRCSWPTEPDVCRVVNGLSGRVDEIKALGNAIVPQVAAEIMSYILEALGIEPEWHI